jgi:hypothetical protein
MEELSVGVSGQSQSFAQAAESLLVLLPQLLEVVVEIASPL